MASYRKRGKSWFVEIWRLGQREGKSFATKEEAKAWAGDRESSLRKGQTSTKHTLKDALERYRNEVSPTKRGWRWEKLRIDAFIRGIPFIDRPMPAITTDDWGKWRDSRLKSVAGSTFNRELNILSAVYEEARREWRWVHSNVIRDVRRSKNPAHREVTISDGERDSLIAELKYGGGKPETLSHEVALALLLALETGMRAGELLGLEWSRINLKEKFVRLPITKNGKARDVPLSKKAVRIIGRFPKRAGRLFQLTPATLDALFRRARDRLDFPFTFHDSRATAITRLSKKLDVLALARMMGHSNIKSLQTYYRESATDLAARLG